MLRDDQRVRIDGLDPGAEALPELVVILRTVSQVRSYIQTPAVNAIWRRKSFFGDFIDLLAQAW